MTKAKAQQPERPRQFSGILTRYLNEVTPRKRGWKSEDARLRAILRDPIAGTQTVLTTGPAVATWRDGRLKVVSPGTVRREWNLLSAICNVAVKEWGWLTFNPFKDISRPPKPKARTRIATETEIGDLYQHAVYGTPYADLMTMAYFALETAMRESEIADLEWAHLREGGRVAHLFVTKNGVERDVPLSRAARDIISRLREDRQCQDKIFPLTARQVANMWPKLCKVANVEGLTFHDLRHTAITQLADKLDVLELARMVGHTDVKSLLTYYNKPMVSVVEKLG